MGSGTRLPWYVPRYVASWYAMVWLAAVQHAGRVASHLIYNKFCRIVSQI